MTRCIPQIILALAILTPSPLHSQSWNIRQASSCENLSQFLGTYTPQALTVTLKQHDLCFAAPLQYYRKNGNRTR